ncbi:uncharacterized protein B0P05DRAFT_590266 [Gilbertella persicaria]|uniref:uncharacterized protein n=1 Tax=Gilbertella persicaria TaxID=101096 RepID=UPI002221157E|nr:uncharacterized protein B0P05DRAFT_590266 [Gilbertella persicaria]KAI8063730.1 hypothetical protein B0P05DRAFT_590266 [Gilbertella persicaria]
MSEDSDDDIELEIVAMEYGAIEMILDYDGMKQAQEVEMEEAVNDLTEEMELVNPLDKADTLTSRIAEAIATVTTEDYVSIQ